MKGFLFNTRQGSLAMSEYHCWMSYGYQYQNLKIWNADDAAHVGVVKKGRIFKFLHGLNQEYDLINDRGNEKVL